MGPRGQTPRGAGRDPPRRPASRRRPAVRDRPLLPEDQDARTVYERVVDEAGGNADALGAVKLKTGLSLLGYGPEEDVELVRRVREAVGSDVTVMVDANYAYDRTDTPGQPGARGRERPLVRGAGPPGGHSGVRPALGDPRRPGRRRRVPHARGVRPHARGVRPAVRARRAGRRTA
ncbi:hypothetical protein BRC93_10400 [Halobacteriales archaeon QS_5_70_15]|nr:MAG: hypothetical protein BRC93_10400 [Halobacteriales archaeon QS_5_70_15]